MDEISKYDLELFLNQNDLSLIDAYIDENGELILEIEKNEDSDIDEEMFIAELELNFEQFADIIYDDEFESFVIKLYDKNTKLID